MATDKQIAASRANAQKSTGATTDEGRERAKLNALRHGLTGQVTVMPHEDSEAFSAFCAEIVSSLNPANALEQQPAQSIALDNWRLNRARAMEDNLLALGHTGEAAEMDAEAPEIHAAVTAARVFCSDPPQFQLLRSPGRSRHPQQDSSDPLPVDGSPVRQPGVGATGGLLIPAKLGQSVGAGGNGIGFVFSTQEIEVYLHHKRRLEQAIEAEYRNWDREKYEAGGYSLAA